MTNISNATDWYTPTLKAWGVKLQGPKVTADQLATAHDLGCRAGKQAMALAMAMREGGVTRRQVDATCGAPQFNKMGEVEARKLTRRVPMPFDALHHMVYKYELTARGTAHVAATRKRVAELAADEAASGEPAKPARKAKVKKAPATPRKPEAISEPDKPAESHAMLLSVDGIPADGGTPLTDM